MPRSRKSPRALRNVSVSGVGNLLEEILPSFSGQKESVRRAWEIFKVDPFDIRLGTHKINNLSARFRKTIYSVVIEANLRAVFYVENDTVWTVDIGTHSVYH